MAGRRKLIVVSNRGPVVHERDASGERVARRGGGGLVTALRSLVEQHDVTWIASAMSAEDKNVAEEAGGEPIPETARSGAPYRLRFLQRPVIDVGVEMRLDIGGDVATCGDLAELRVQRPDERVVVLHVEPVVAPGEAMAAMRPSSPEARWSRKPSSALR